ncbi:AAA family ATPase [Streptomyces erythrochromogenes]|uniref:AAA family ATPase n=1 Tax=Streptomyces erythrochromogenes TaxID=285574 RepID=UPI0036A399E5
MTIARLNSTTVPREFDFAASEVFEFFHTVYGPKPPVLTFIVSRGRNAQGKIQPEFHRRAKPTAALISELLELGRKPGHEVFFRVAPMGRDGLDTTKADVLPVNASWTEVDSHGLTEEDMSFLDGIGAVVVDSGGVADDGGAKTHVYVPLDVPHPPEQIGALNRALRNKLRGDKFDVTTMLRLPGTWHRKDQSVGGARLCTMRTRSRSRRRQSLPNVAQALGTDVSSTSVRERTDGASLTPVAPPRDSVLWSRGRGRRRTVDQQIFAAELNGESIDRDDRMWGLYKDLAEAGMRDGNHILWAAMQCSAAKTEKGERWMAGDVARFLASDDYAVIVAGKSVAPPSAGEVLTEDQPEADRPEKFRRLDWAASFVKDFTEVDWLPGRFVERGQQVSLVADGKVGKSLFILDWCLALALEWKFLDHSTGNAYRVLYFDRENSERDIITRARSLGLKAEHLAVLGERFDYRQFPQFDGTLDNPEKEAAKEFVTIVDEVKPDVVIIDTASRFIGGKEDSSDTWLQLYQLIHEPLKARGIACIRLDHFGKDEGKGSRGSSAKSQDVDHVWEMTRKSTADAGAQVVTTLAMKRTHTRTGYGEDRLSIVRVGTKTPRGLWQDGGTSHQLQTSEEAKQDVLFEGLNRPERILEILRERAPKPMTTTELMVHFPEINRKTIQRDLSDLENDGRITRTGQSNAPSWMPI